MQILVGINELGIIDHVNALSHQMLTAGADVTYISAATSLLEHNISDIYRVVPRGANGNSLWSQDPPDLENFHAVVVQTPYEEHRNAIWQAIGVHENLTYAGYGTPLSNWQRGHYDLDFYARCRFLLTSSVFALREYRSRGIRDDRLRCVGDPLLFEVRAKSKAVSPNAAPTILWLPHWTLDWFGAPGYSNWLTTVHDVLNVARSTGVRVIVRPHPLLSRALQGAATSRAQEALSELVGLTNVTLSVDSLLSDLLSASAVITDGVSVISYACAAGLPVAVCRREDSPRFNSAGEDIMSQCDIVASEDARVSWLRNQSESITPRDPHSAAARCVYEWFPLGRESPGETFLNWLSE